jgi:hypothetical protein
MGDRSVIDDSETVPARLIIHANCQRSSRRGLTVARACCVFQDDFRVKRMLWAWNHREVERRRSERSLEGLVEGVFLEATTIRN